MGGGGRGERSRGRGRGTGGITGSGVKWSQGMAGQAHYLRPLHLKPNCYTLRNKATILESRSQQALPRHLDERLHHSARRHRQQLDDKLRQVPGMTSRQVCASSPCNSAGNTGLITNLSSRLLSRVETGALSLGLKFDTGKNNSRYLDDIIRNTKYTDSDIDKGFKQGFTTCLSALAGSSRPVIPWRYMVSLQGLARDSDIVISASDKGGGVIILDRSTYDSKMHEVLSDNVTYVRSSGAGHLQKGI